MLAFEARSAGRRGFAAVVTVTETRTPPHDVHTEAEAGVDLGHRIGGGSASNAGGDEALLLFRRFAEAVRVWG